jgi:hypothetical protein
VSGRSTSEPRAEQPVHHDAAGARDGVDVSEHGVGLVAREDGARGPAESLGQVQLEHEVGAEARARMRGGEEALARVPTDGAQRAPDHESVAAVVARAAEDQRASVALPARRQALEPLGARPPGALHEDRAGDPEVSDRARVDGAHLFGGRDRIARSRAAREGVRGAHGVHGRSASDFRPRGSRAADVSARDVPLTRRR